MTDPLEGSPLEALDLPDDVFGLGAGEIAYLLARHETPANERSRTLLMLDPRTADDGVLLAGASGLAARGWLTLRDDGTRETRSNAALVEYAVGATSRWTRIGFVGDDVAQLDFAVYLESDSVTALLQPRALAAWFIRLGQPDQDGAGLIDGIVRERLTARPGSGVFLEVSTLEDRSNLAIRAVDDGFEVRRDAAGPGTGVGGVVDAAGLREAVAGLYAESVTA